MKYKTPLPLKHGDTIGVMAPSSRIDLADLENGADVLRRKGYNVLLHPQCHAKLNQSAGTNEQKRDALHNLVRNPDVKAIFFATGGNRALHILDLLDYELIKKHPKIYMGFSDNTALLNTIAAKSGVVTYHGPTVKRLPKNPQVDFNLSLLSGQEKEIPMTGAKMFREGNATGVLIGGNLNVFRRLIGSKEMPDTQGAILFFEDCNEETSRLDAELCFMRRSGLFDNAAALIFGQFTGLLDTGTPFGFTFDEIVREHTAGLNIPILMNAPFGHTEDLYAYPIGATVQLDNDKLRILD